MPHQGNPPDLQAFERDIDSLRHELGAASGPEDLRLAHRMERWGWACTALGLATCWLGPNPIAVLGLALGAFARWTVVAHHACHGGYDRMAGAPQRWTSRAFARGWRRAIDWMDWMAPDAWRHEHNVAHHYRLGEQEDPDQPEENLGWLRRSSLPMPVRMALVLALSLVWKPVYYAPNTMNALLNHRRRHLGPPLPLGAWWRSLEGARRASVVLVRCWLPYAALRFGLLPAAFLAISHDAWHAALVNLLLAELVTNLHSFWIIVPNHAGEDLPRFDRPATGRAERLWRQVVGSANYATGTDRADFLQGFLNYQIEHHVWPDLTHRQYRLAQPLLKALCACHGVPYVQESLWRRCGKTLDVLVGRTTMPRVMTSASDP